MLPVTTPASSSAPSLHDLHKPHRFSRLALACGLLALGGLAQATVIFDNFRGQINIPGNPTLITPNYNNNEGNKALNNLIQFAADQQNIATSGSLDNIDWTNASPQLCNRNFPNSEACQTQIQGRVIYAMVQFPQAGSYTFQASHDDDLQIDFSTNFSADDASNYRSFDYNVPVGKLASYTSPNSYPNVPGNFIATQDNSCYAMRVYWNNRGDLNFLRMRWLTPGSTSGVIIPAANLLDPSRPESYASCATAPTDLGINKTGPAQFAPGGKLSYTIKVWNYGPNATSNIPVADQLPDNVTLDGPPTCTASGSAACGSMSNVDKAWVMTTGALPVNNTAGDPALAPTQGSYLSYTFTVTAAADALSIENTATITTQDLNPDNNTSSLISHSTAQASVQKTAPAKVTVGQEFDYTLTLTNGLPSAIASAVVADQLPPNVKALSASGATCSGLPSAPGALLSCTLAAPVAANGTGQFTIRAVATGLGVATNYASTSPSGSNDPGTPGPDCNTTPYSCTNAKTQTEAPAVSIRKSFSPTVISTQGASLLTITVSNANSSVNLTGLRLTDTLPAGLHTQGDMAGNTCEGTLSSDGSTLTLSGGTLAAGAECQLKWLVASSTVGTYPNTIPAGNVRTAEGASNTAPANATLEVRAPADIDTAKTLLTINGVPAKANQRLRAGDKLDYQITVSNAGGTAGSTKLTETVPHGAKYIGVNEGWTATCSTEASTCEQTVSIPANGNTVVHFTMEVVRPVLKSTIVNTVASDTGDCDNCSYSSPVVSADMAATGATVQNVKVGDEVSVVTTCTNLGTDYGVNATCTVTGAPAGATTVCTPAQPVAQFQVGAVFTCTTKFKAEAPGTVILTTTAKSDTRDARPSNNAANSAVNITEATPPVVPTPAPTPVPVDSRWMLLLTALAVALLAYRQKLRKA